MNKRRMFLNLLFIIAGGMAGYLYWYFIGCNSGSCPITSKWFNTTIFGVILGYLIGSSIMDIFDKKKGIKID